MELDQALKVDATNSYRCPDLSRLLETPSVCSIVLKKVLRCYKNGKKKAINNGRETDYHNT